MTIETAERLYAVFMKPHGRGGFNTNNPNKAIPRAAILDVLIDGGPEDAIVGLVPAETYLRHAGYRLAKDSDLAYLRMELQRLEGLLVKAKVDLDDAEVADAMTQEHLDLADQEVRVAILAVESARELRDKDTLHWDALTPEEKKDPKVSLTHKKTQSDYQEAEDAYEAAEAKAKALRLLHFNEATAAMNLRIDVKSLSSHRASMLFQCQAEAASFDKVTELSKALPHKVKDIRRIRRR